MYHLSGICFKNVQPESNYVQPESNYEETIEQA